MNIRVNIMDGVLRLMENLVVREEIGLVPTYVVGITFFHSNG